MYIFNLLQGGSHGAIATAIFISYQIGCMGFKCLHGAILTTLSSINLPIS